MLRQLLPADAPDFLRLRREALALEPFAFAASPEDDRASSIEAARGLLAAGPESVVLGVFDDEVLVGAVGVYRDTRRKAAHKAHVWGMYVSAAARGRGLARALLAAAVTQARSLDGVRQVHLGVSERSAAARRLYESFGFRRWGTEPAALRHFDESVAEHHLVLALRDDEPSGRGEAQ